MIKHATELLVRSPDGKSLKLGCVLRDGVRVTHEISAGDDAVTFRLIATNPTCKPSEVHWAQPCIRVNTFTGKGQRDYLPHCFVFFDGKLTRLPTDPWAKQARYVPGQVYCPANVDRRDVNPRPLSPLVPSNGLIGCFSGDGKMLMATAWEPYQELFQGVAVCIHADFRIGGLKPGESKSIRGKIYLMRANPDTLLRRYELPAAPVSAATEIPARAIEETVLEQIQTRDPHVDMRTEAPSAQLRLVRLWIGRVDYDAAQNKVAITFNPSGSSASSTERTDGTQETNP